MKAQITQIKEKIEVRALMLLVVGGTTLLAFIGGTGVIVNGPGRP